MIEVRDEEDDKWVELKFIIFVPELKYPYVVAMEDNGADSYKQARPLNPIRTEIEALKARLNELEAKL